MCIDLAIAIAEGWARSRKVILGTYRERIYYWPGRDDSESGWWLISPRIEERASRLIGMARQLIMSRRGAASEADVGALLRRWRVTRQWRKYAAQISPVILARGARSPVPTMPPPIRQHKAMRTKARAS